MSLAFKARMFRVRHQCATCMTESARHTIVSIYCGGCKFWIDFRRRSKTTHYSETCGLVFTISLLDFTDNRQGSHRHWKTWKNETTFTGQGKVRNFEKMSKSQGILSK